MEIAAHSGLMNMHPPPHASQAAAHSRIASNQGPPPSLMSHQSFQSQYSSYSHSSARDTQSTQHTSSSTLFGGQPPPNYPPTPVNGGPIEASDNVLNKRADKDAGLFQRCLSLQLRLRLIPGFASWMADEESKADDDADPVTLLWRTFRRGYPLMELYNALEPRVPLSIPNSKTDEKSLKKNEKMATYKFIQSCVTELGIPQENCFIIGDLYGDDTTGFVKVTNVVSRVLDSLVALGKISATQASEDGSGGSGKRTQREHIIDELVRTERTYVQHLELLHEFKKLVEEKGVISGDQVHDIFLNLNALLDFQRRFLIRVEQTNAQPASEQNWGNLFVLYKEAFKVYEPYIANQKKCEQIAMREFDKLKETGGSPEMRQMVESPTHLTSFLLKPFQRLTKYPLLLSQLRDKGDLDEQRRDDISRGIEAASSVLAGTNDAIAREERVEAVEELKTLVEDWKGHRIEGFGDLLLYGQYTVLKGESMTSKNEEREYKIYLFEMILLCCKEININKPKNKMSTRTLVTKDGKPKLQLKGRIFMQNVTETISLQKPGSYTCQIFWKGDPGIENFIIRFTTEAEMKKWATQVDMQRRHWKDHARSSASTTHSKPSDTQFAYMRDQVLENPYREDDDDDGDDDVDTVTNSYRAAHNSSSASMRSRSTTGESGPPIDGDPRVPPSRFPMSNSAQAPLTLRTQQLQNGGAQESYFSPTVETPMSSYSNARTSSSSAGTFPFPRQQPPNGYSHEENNRYTAPAQSRNHMSRDGSAQYAQARSQRPSLPPNAAMSSQGRMRAASSPDINSALGPNRKMQNGQAPPVPDMPPFPTHYAYNAAIVNRSANNSPANNPPPRAATQSPAIQRDRLIQQRTAAELANTDYHGGALRRDPSYQPPLSRTMTPASSFERSQGTLTPASMESRNMSPPLSQQESSIPTQLKVKVHCPSAGSTMVLVVSTNISFQSLKDRIDAKLQRSTSVSLGSGQVKLKYLDSENTYVSIQCDDDVQEAFENWKEQQRDLNPGGGQLGEIELFCQR
ncbi:Pleckstrin homology domain-containing protein [Paraphoma chrysanthemicola]|uniref:Pleckstrin homology domain-containing protein n=1 Tax=Paraphoma chrysanthemicola TaxID=798071 RepID=A0A8K0RF55_9PLEO|nr:Pleckstrin homology domain-containing protein [Paraphoma chrysanthemicola]